jgi:hypothetical protein
MDMLDIRAGSLMVALLSGALLAACGGGASGNAGSVGIASASASRGQDAAVSIDASTASAKAQAMSASTTADTSLHALMQGQSLATGASLWSPSARYQLIMQADGNLVLYDLAYSQALMSSNTYNAALAASNTSANYSAVMQGDGNFVVYTSANRPLWATNTANTGAQNLVLQDDGNLVLYKGTRALWAAATSFRGAAPVNPLQNNQALTIGAAIKSPSGRYELTLQPDGNVVVYDMTTSTALWATNTAGKNVVKAEMQTDGNFVLYDSANKGVWDTKTYNGGGKTLQLGDDGNLVIRDANQQVKWTSASSTSATGGSQGTTTAPASGTTTSAGTGTSGGSSTSATTSGTASGTGSSPTAPVASNLPSAVVTPASQFVDSIGMNVHLRFPAYIANYATIKQALLTLGIRHLREGFPTDTDADFYSKVNDLASHGIKMDMVTYYNQTIAAIEQGAALMPGALEYIESPNEYDNPIVSATDPLWNPHLIAYQQTLYRGVKASPALSGIPVIGASLIKDADYAAMAGQSAYMDFGNMHNYFEAFPPGFAGWIGDYASQGLIRWNRNSSAQESGSKTVISTETGYCTMTNVHNTVPTAIQARYMPRMFLEEYLGGVPLTYDYELIDDGNAGCDTNFGLLTSTMQPKPAFGALSAFIAQLADTAPSPTGGRLGLDIQSANPALHSLLFGKSDGSYVLALWLEESGWDVDHLDADGQSWGAFITNAPATVTVRLARTPGQSAARVITDAGTLSSTALSWSGGLTSLSVSDNVTLLQFKP